MTHRDVGEARKTKHGTYVTVNPNDDGSWTVSFSRSNEGQKKLATGTRRMCDRVAELHAMQHGGWADGE